MKHAVFITGFNNWGKSSIIFELFGRQRFFFGETYPLTGLKTEFTVESHSNDDWWGQRWADNVSDRLADAPNRQSNLFTALCPTMHENSNHFVELLNSPPFNRFDKKHIFLIEYKWEHHAKLITENIRREARRIRNVNVVEINADTNLTNDTERFSAKINQIMNELNRIFSE